MQHGTVRRNADLPHLESLSRLSTIPLIEFGWNYAGSLYDALKHSNPLTEWGCNRAELTINAAVNYTVPIGVAIVGKSSIAIIDQLLCKSLDVLHERVPSIDLPPQMMYWNTKQYMNTKLVRPVLKRADSVKHLGNQVLHNKHVEYAASSLDNALTVADKYVEKYLPSESDIDEDTKQTSLNDADSGQAVKTIHHVDRFSRKFKRRLTQHAIAEAKALKKQSKEAIHVLIYVAELVATDPKLALQKARELWASLSKDEPENQARPATLEQLIVMITRETARRIVHLINATSNQVTQFPTTLNQTARNISIQFLTVADNLVKTIRMDGVKQRVIVEFKSHAEKLRAILQMINDFANQTLLRLAHTLAGHSPISINEIKPSQQQINKNEKKLSAPNQSGGNHKQQNTKTTTITTLAVNTKKQRANNHNSDTNHTKNHSGNNLVTSSPDDVSTNEDNQ